MTTFKHATNFSVCYGKVVTVKLIGDECNKNGRFFIHIIIVKKVPQQNSPYDFMFIHVLSIDYVMSNVTQTIIKSQFPKRVMSNLGSDFMD